MKNKVTWLLLGSLIVIALVLASCAPAAPPSTPATPSQPAVQPAQPNTPAQPTSSVPAADTGNPKYGGTLNIIGGGAFEARWDVFGPSSVPVMAIYEGLLYGNWYLPESVNPNYYATFTEKTVAGWLAESWEMQDPQNFVFHLRKGVKFQNKAPVNGRELVANDVKWSYETFIASPLTGKGLIANFDKITCPDKYTVVFHTATPMNPDFLTEAFLAGSTDGGMVAPHEIIDQYGAQGFSNWKNSNGTGPWIATDTVEGSSTMFAKNPNYWDFDKNYPDNRLPYVDNLRILWITDASTKIAAFRTGKVDTYAAVWDEVESLTKTNPWVKHRSFPAQGASMLAMNYHNKPLTDIRVRQALTMAVDHKAIVKDIYGGHAIAALDTGPYFQNAYREYQPAPSEYPQIVRDLYAHNLSQAKQLLADAGFPSGFKTEIRCEQTQIDMMTLIKSYFADIGVQADIKVMDAASISTSRYKHDFPGLAIHNITGAVAASSPNQLLGKYYNPTSTSNYSGYDSQVLQDTYAKAKQTQDREARLKLYKECATIIMMDAPNILLPSPDRNIFWQPWIKGGYWGQAGMSWEGRNHYKYLWLDQDSKKSITGGK